MAYYAAIVSLVELLKEISHPIPNQRCPKPPFEKQQITCLYEKFSLLQVLLEDYSPNDKEAAGFLKRIRDVACLMELTIELKTSYATSAAYDEAKRMIESQIREPNCLAEIIRLLCFRIFVSAYHNSEPVNEEVDQSMRKGYRDLSKLRKALGHVVQIGYEDLENLKKDVDSIMGEGYFDVVCLKEEIDSIALKGYQDLVKLNEELDAIWIKGYHDLDSVEEAVESIVGKGHEDLERVKEEVDSVVGNGYDELLEKVLKKEVDPIVEELMIRIKDSHTTRQEDLHVNVGGPSNDGTTMVLLHENRITTIKDQILGDSSKLEVISIVGMGGIGKTTLAIHLFDDKHILNHFDFRVWVIVSQSYDLLNILKAIVNSLNLNKSKEDLNRIGEDVLKDLIYKHLFGQRYLIIMDDVWDLKILDDVRWIFPRDPNGSRIMITTRQSDIASIASASGFINQISTLTQHQSWTLFREKVVCPPELEDIGRFIVKNCGGLPLAIVVVAGLLSKTSKTRDHWADIARRVSLTAAENDERFSKILSLSYDRLPHHLKPCFLYLGRFPEDKEISISRLAKLWVAEGFLKPVASKCLEEVAEEYLEELVKRNLVLVTKWRSNGNFKSCMLHDLLRDLCLQRAHQEHFLLLPHKHIATDHAYRFFIHPDSSSSDIDKHKNINGHSIVSCDAANRSFKSPCLRVLHVRSTMQTAALSEDDTFSDDRVCEFLNLRFLEISFCINTPSTIVQLQHLQTLILDSWLHYFNQISLPAEIWKMPQLRHVLGKNMKFPDGGRKTSDRLPSLQTLSGPRNFTVPSRIAEMIPSIKKLKLEYVQKHKHCKNVWTRFGLTNLVHLHQLETLAIEIDFPGFLETPFPEGLALPSNLRKLTLEGCQLPWRNMKVVGTLPHLQVLKLRRWSLVDTTWESKEGEFSKLKFLEMSSLFIENWLTESTHFPCLEHLVIKDCNRLNGIPSETGEFPNLKLIEVWSTDSQVKASALAIQEEQSSFGNETLQVRVYDR